MKNKRKVKQITSDILLLIEIAQRYANEAIGCSPAASSRLRADANQVIKIAKLVNREISAIHSNVKQACSNRTCLYVSAKKIEKDLHLLPLAIRKLILDSKKIVSKCRAPIRGNSQLRKSRDIAEEVVSAISSLPDEVLAW
jgi:hypothetical protein